MGGPGAPAPGRGVTFPAIIAARRGPKLEQARVNLYVDNLFDEADYKDPYKKFFAYANERVFQRVGREISAEFVYKFD